ncbi:MAG: YHS domain-containing (seleno)protein [Pseudomonadales bacterium]|jgi:YHS domain-containing protein
MKFPMKISGILLLVSALVLAVNASAKPDPVYTSFFSSLAAGGHDVVAYFMQYKSVKGKSKFSTDYLEAQWRFSTAENLAKFRSDPKKYAPQYGGYCAWAISQGYTAKGDPEYWRIVGGKLYLNYNEDIQNTWEADIPGFVKLAEKNWPMILGE